MGHGGQIQILNMIYELMNLERGYVIRIENDSRYGEDYVCESDDLVSWAGKVKQLLDRINTAGSSKERIELRNFVEELGLN